MKKLILGLIFILSLISSNSEALFFGGRGGPYFSFGFGTPYYYRPYYSYYRPYYRYSRPYYSSWYDYDDDDDDDEVIYYSY